MFVVLAEMGDKTQLLAMAFATRFKTSTVLWGVFVATAANHLFAVEVGTWLTNFIPLSYIQIAAAASFILFGLWTIRGDELEGEDKRFSFSPFWTVAIAFFVAEMGDKTQLATVALAAKYQTVLQVWIGTTTGMMIADAFGIGVGIVLGKRIPERVVKWVAAVIFILFGFYGLHENLPPEVLTLPLQVAVVIIVALAALLIGTGSLSGRSMRVNISCMIRTDAAKMWEALQKPASLMRVAAPILTFRPLGGTELPQKWDVETAYPFRLYAFGILPLGNHHIVVKKIDHEQMQIITNESGLLAKHWDHFVRVERIDETTVRYTDSIEIQAGLLTLGIWLFAHLFYRHRQRQWKLLMAG